MLVDLKKWGSVSKTQLLLNFSWHMLGCVWSIGVFLFLLSTGDSAQYDTTALHHCFRIWFLLSANQNGWSKAMSQTSPTPIVTPHQPFPARYYQQIQLQISGQFSHLFWERRPEGGAVGWIFGLYSPLLHTGTSMAGRSSVDATHQQDSHWRKENRVFLKLIFWYQILADLIKNWSDFWLSILIDRF